MGRTTTTPHPPNDRTDTGKMLNNSCKLVSGYSNLNHTTTFLQKIILFIKKIKP